MSEPITIICQECGNLDTVYCDLIPTICAKCQARHREAVQDEIDKQRAEMIDPARISALERRMDELERQLGKRNEIH